MHLFRSYVLVGIEFIASLESEKRYSAFLRIFRKSYHVKNKYSVTRVSIFTTLVFILTLLTLLKADLQKSNITTEFTSYSEIRKTFNTSRSLVTTFPKIKIYSINQKRFPNRAKTHFISHQTQSSPNPTELFSLSSQTKSRQYTAHARPNLSNYNEKKRAPFDLAVTCKNAQSCTPKRASRKITYMCVCHLSKSVTRSSAGENPDADARPR